jgi:peptidylprolyl isomerase
MSYLFKTLLVCCCFIPLFIQCEDTKNENKSTNEKELNTPANILKITPETVHKDSIITPNKLEKITQENLIPFLTQYGKDNPETKVKFTTPQGSIEIELFNDTPLHRANFIHLVKRGYFNTTYFYRVVANFIIQAGTSDNKATQDDRYAIGHSYRIPNEIKRKHSFGTLSGAKYYRDNDDKKTEPFEFFIFLGPKTSTKHLDGNYTVFGKVTKGMEVVQKIANTPKDDKEWPLQNVTITAEVIQ